MLDLSQDTVARLENFASLQGSTVDAAIVALLDSAHYELQETNEPAEISLRESFRQQLLVFKEYEGQLGRDWLPLVNWYFEPEEIPLHGGGVAIVDRIDARFSHIAAGAKNLRERRWSKNRNGFASTRVKMPGGVVRQVLMHDFILGHPPEATVRHLDGDRLNNRRNNLILSTPFRGSLSEQRASQVMLEMETSKTLFPLTIELIPSLAWGQNAREILSETAWDKVRESVLLRCKGICEICRGHTGKIDAHEVWDWDDELRTQTLVKVMGICKMCHLAKHPDHSRVLDNQGAIRMPNVVLHFCRVNNCELSDYEEAEAQATRLRDSRCNTIWRMNCSHVIEEYGVRPRNGTTWTQVVRSDDWPGEGYELCVDHDNGSFIDGLWSKSVAY